MKKSEYKKLVILGIGAAIVIALSIFTVLGLTQSQSRNLKKETLKILNEGIDYSNSKFPDEDLDQIKIDIQKRRELVESSSNISNQTLVDIAFFVQQVRDFDKAERLYLLVDASGYSDKGYKLNQARVYMELKEWESARKILEELTLTYPFQDSFILLADVYKNISDTPNYVIDEIYETGIKTHIASTGLKTKYIDWLESSGREQLALPIYMELIKEFPDSGYEGRIQELQQKYQ